MRVAIVSSAALTTPPPFYGGLEMIAFADAVRLSKKHDVVLYAKRGSRAVAQVFADEYGLDLSFEVAEVFEHSEAPLRVEADVVIDHSWGKVAASASPSVQVFHGVYRTPHDVPKPVGVSRTHAEVLRSLYGRAWYVYGHTLEEMYRVGDSDRERLLLFLGRAAREKGLLNFIEACRLLRPEGFRCAFVGDDSADWEYALLAYSRAREAGVEWLGLQPHDVKASLLRRAYAVVVLPLPPYVEVFGLWALEAFLSGTPVITTRAGAMAEYVVDGWNGRLTSGDPREVAEAARASFKAKPHELRTYALENFSSEEMAKRLVEIALAE